MEICTRTSGEGTGIMITGLVSYYSQQFSMWLNPLWIEFFISLANKITQPIPPTVLTYRIEDIVPISYSFLLCLYPGYTNGHQYLDFSPRCFILWISFFSSGLIRQNKFNSEVNVGFYNSEIVEFHSTYTTFVFF